VNLPQVGRKHRSPEFGVELDIVYIAHCENAQALFDKHELAWGTVFELARGVTRGMWKFQDMTEPRLQQLKGTNTQSAWKVATVMADKVPFTMRAHSELWYEFYSFHNSRAKIDIQARI
jgi:RNA-dependent RNA polymerase